MLRRFCHHSHQDAFMPWPALPDSTQPHTWPHTSSHTVAHLISQLVTPGHTLSHLMGPFHGHAWSHLVTLCSTVAPGAEARSLTALLGGKHGVNMLVKHLGQNAAAILSHLVGAGHGGSVYGGGWGLVAHVIPFPPPYVAGAVMQTGNQVCTVLGTCPPLCQWITVPPDILPTVLPMYRSLGAAWSGTRTR